MQFKSQEERDHAALSDRVSAAMETGNQGQARTLVEEYSDVNPALADSLRTEVLREYGVSL